MRSRRLLSLNTAALHNTVSVVALAQLVAEGDSLTANDFSPPELWHDNNPGVSFVNCAVGGSGIDTMVARLAATMANDPSHMTILIGANDLMGYASAAAFCAALFDHIADCKVIKPSMKAIVCGIPPIDEAAPANTAGDGKAGFNVRCIEVDALLDAAVGVEIDGFIPYSRHPDLPDSAAEDPALTDDGLHWKPAGYAIMGEMYDAVMDPVLAEATGSTPSAFSFEDQANAEASSVQTARIIVTGMGLGERATASMTGDGDFRVGRGTYGTSNLSVMNGDIITSRITASATPEASLAQVVTINGVSDTFTVTTEAAAGGDFAATADGQYRSGGFANTTETFTGVAHPGGIPFVIAFTNGGRTFTSIVYGGQTLSALAGMDNGDYKAFIGTGDLVAGSYSLAVTCNATIADLRVFPGALTGIASTTPVDTAFLSQSFRFEGTQSATSAITLGSGDIGIMWGGANSTPTLSNYAPSGTLVKQYAAVDGFVFFFAKYTTSGTPSFDVDTGSGTSTTVLSAGGFG